MTHRLYVPDNLTLHDTLTLTESTHHYISHVLRCKKDAMVRLFNGKDGEFLGKIVSVTKKDCDVYVAEKIRQSTTDTPLVLYMPPLRPTRMAYLLEKITELGVTDYYPIQTDHTAFPLGKISRIERIFIEAAEQCERLTLPRLHPIQPLESILNDAPILWAYERSSYSFEKTSSRFLLIGPEGGFSEREIHLLKNHSNVQEVSLGSSILRAETAAMGGLFLMGLSQT